MRVFKSDLRTRRAYLAAILISLFGGCVSEPSDPPALGSITLLNTRDQPVEATLTVDKNGERVHVRRYDIDGRDGSTVDGPLVLESWMGTGSDFEIEVVVPSIGTETFSTTEFGEKSGYEYDCVPLDVFIENDHIEIYYGMNGCSEV